MEWKKITKRLLSAFVNRNVFADETTTENAKRLAHLNRSLRKCRCFYNEYKFCLTAFAGSMLKNICFHECISGFSTNEKGIFP